MPPNADTLLNRFVVKAKIRHMQVLVKLAELGSMRRAARAVNMTQPAISQLVAELEKLLETDLFFRHARGVAPTDAAKDLLPMAQRILDALRDGSESMANRLLEQGGVVRVSASPAAIGGIIHDRLDAFAQRAPDIQIIISETGNGEPLEGITEASADMICTREPAVIPEGWRFVKCIDDALVVVCGTTHPLARGDDCALERLGAHKWLLNRVGSVARNRFEQVSAQHDWPPAARCNIIMHIPRLTKEMLETGNYLAILPRSVALPWLDDGAVVELDTNITTDLAPLGFLWKPDRAGPATTTFAKFIAP